MIQGARWRRPLLAASIVGASAFVFGVTRGDASQTWGIYLVNFLFWSGLAQAGAAFSALLHLARARWGGRVQAIAESMAAFLPASFVLAFVLPLGHDRFYHWLPSASAKERGWLSPPFVSARLLAGLAVLYGLSLLFIRRPRWRDRLAPAVLIAYCCVLTLLSFDWVMSLDPRWFSTLAGGHFFVATFYAGLSAIALLAVLSRRSGGLAEIPAPVMHDHGKLLLGFCMLWTYLVFTQYLVIWYGDLPEETGFVLRRTAENGWPGLAAFVLASCFFLPFSLLLSRRLKQSAGGMAAVATLALLGLFAERILLVMPSLTEGPSFGLVELAVSAGFCAVFLLCILPKLEREHGGSMSKNTGPVVAAAAFLVCWAAAAPAHAQIGSWEAPPEAKNIKRPAPADDKSVERGKKLFTQNCVPCHGTTGKGDGAMGKAMGIKPGNLTDSARMGKHADGEIFWKVGKGKDPMPVFEKKLSEKERWDVVAYVRTLAK